jgi:protein required for attachment to host cells
MIGPRTPMTELADMVHPQSRIHEQKLTSDRPGRTFDRYGQGHHALEKEVGARQQEVMGFAAQLADYLQTKCGKEAFTDIVIIAAPEFLGVLRKKLDPGTRERVVREIDKNIVQHDEADIRKHLY